MFLVIPEPWIGSLITQLGCLASHRVQVKDGFDAGELRGKLLDLLGGIGRCHAESLREVSSADGAWHTHDDSAAHNIYWRSDTGRDRSTVRHQPPALRGATAPRPPPAAEEVREPCAQGVGPRALGWRLCLFRLVCSPQPAAHPRPRPHRLPRRTASSPSRTPAGSSLPSSPPMTWRVPRGMSHWSCLWSTRRSCR